MRKVRKKMGSVARKGKMKLLKERAKIELKL
jgi:hypothetical protein